MTYNKEAASQNKAKHLHRRLFQVAMWVRSFFPVLTGLSFIYSVIVIGQMFLLSLIIDSVFIRSETPALYLYWFLLALIIFRALLIWLRERFAQQKAVIFKSGLRMNLYRHLLQNDPVRASKDKIGELVGNLTDGIEKLDDYFTKFIPSVVQILVLPLAIVAYVIFTDWLSGLIMFLTAPLILFFMWLIGTMAKNLTRRQWKEMSAMASHFLDALQGMKTLKIFNANAREAGLVAVVSNRFRIVTMKVLRVAFLSGMVLELAASISIAMVALQVGIRLIEGMMDYQAGLFVLLLTPEFYLPFRTLGQHHHTGMEAAAAAEKIFDISDTVSNKIIEKANISINTQRIEIDFKEVSFVYPESSVPAVENVNCRLEASQLTAIVGATGSGKTTFSHLLMGLLQPSSGTILLNGIPLEHLDETEKAKLIAWVPQHPHFFNGSIIENLKMANPEATLAEIEDACKLALLHDFISDIPEGYDTILSENASRLSGGEKQRLAIARAYLKNAPLLILDEPTSNLDPESEELVALATESLLKNRTSIIIAHRLKTIYRADKILVFKEGKIIESGNHQLLVSLNGLYARYMDMFHNSNYHI